MRDRVLPATLFAIVIFEFLAKIIGGLGIVERDFFISTYVAATGRVMAILCVTLITGIQVQKMYDSKEMDRMLAQPISRTCAALSIFTGFLYISFIICLTANLALIFLSPATLLHKILWSLSLQTECILMTSLAVALTTVLGRAVISTIYSMSIYFVGRIIAFIMLDRPDQSTMYNHLWILKAIVKTLSFSIPRLDMTAQSSWLIHGIENPWPTFISHMQLLSYCAMMIFVAIHDINKKQF